MYSSLSQHGIAVAYCFDNAHFNHAKVALFSLLKNSSGPVRLYLLTTGLEPATQRDFERVPRDACLEAGWGARNVTFARARNPHSGFLAITRSELAHWMAQPHFLDLDCSFVGPMESAASLAMLKTFPVYKASRDSQDFCQIQHLDRKFSALRPA